jgi:hypothetical protein
VVTGSVNRGGLPDPSSKSAEDELKAQRVALEARAWRLFATRRKVRLELGRTFLQLKATFKHGEWTKGYYSETFGATGVSFRTVQRWMKKAREANLISKNDKMTLFPPALDADAVKTREATAKAEAEGSHKLTTGEIQLEGLRIYRLPIHLTGDQRDRTDELRRLPKWPRAEQKIIDLLNQLHVEFGIINGTEKEQPG